MADNSIDYLYIGGRVKSTASDEVALETGDIIETVNTEIVPEGTKPTQSNINSSLKSQIDALQNQNFETLTASNTDITIADVFDNQSPAVTPTTNTVYRIANWKGNDASTKYNESYYSEYAATGTTTADLVLLDVVDKGIDDEPTAGSDNLVKSGGVADAIDTFSSVPYKKVFSTGDVLYGYAMNASGVIVDNIHPNYKLAKFYVNEGDFLIESPGSGAYYTLWKYTDDTYGTPSQMIISSEGVINKKYHLSTGYYALGWVGDVNLGAVMYLNKIDTIPTVGSTNLITSWGVAGDNTFNINKFMSHPSAYSSVSEARNSVPSDYRKIGMEITYLWVGGWRTERFIGSVFTGDDYLVDENNWVKDVVDVNKKYPIIFTQGYIIMPRQGHPSISAGEYVSIGSSNYAASNTFIPITQGQKIIVSNTFNDICGIAYYDSNKSFVSGYNGSIPADNIITVPSDVTIAYFRIGYYNSNGVDVTISYVAEFKGYGSIFIEKNTEEIKELQKTKQLTGFSSQFQQLYCENIFDYTPSIVNVTALNAVVGFAITDKSWSISKTPNPSDTALYLEYCYRHSSNKFIAIITNGTNNRCIVSQSMEGTSGIVEIVSTNSNYPFVFFVNAELFANVTVTSGSSMGLALKINIDKMINTPFEYVYLENLKLQDNIDHPLKGMNIVTLGDSITQGVGSGGIHTLGYPEKLAELSGANVYNGGIGGTRLTDMQITDTTLQTELSKLSVVRMAQALANGNFTNVLAAAQNVDTIESTNVNEASINHIKNLDITNIDIVIISAGTNDFNASATGSTGSMDNTTIYGAINYISETLLAANPELKILVCTPIVRWFDDGMQDDDLTKWSDNYQSSSQSNRTLPELCAAIADAATKQHLLVADNYWHLCWNPTNYSQFTADGTHPNATGHLVLAKHIYSQIKNILV